MRIAVYNAIGQRVQVLVNEFRPAGSHQLTFNGDSLTSGAYFFIMQTPDFNHVRIMTLVK